MNTFKLIFISLLIINLGLKAQFDSKVDFKGELYKSMTYNSSYIDTINLVTLPDNIKKVIDSYITRRSLYKTKLKSETVVVDRFIYEAGLSKKRYIEKAIYSILSIPNIDSLGADFAENFKLYYEWEGMSECPLAEADSIKYFLNKNTPIKPYLQVLLLHRLKCASETLIYEEKYSKYENILSEYKELLTNIYNQDNLLIKLIAEDMDKQEYLYMKNKKKLE
ncbi:MAG: hypothetical protein GQ534_05275 [Candidatus Delongbacteria bacterium]|nr:hypothetical protein [Candidatus Delongbacteria bacterium]